MKELARKTQKTSEQELVDELLDFITASTSLAKKILTVVRQKKEQERQ